MPVLRVQIPQVFFSLHLASRTAATKMYAVEYCEVAVVRREEVLKVLDRFPYIQELFARQVQRQRWRVWSLLQRALTTMRALLIDAVSIRSELKKRIYSPSDFQRLILGCIEADFCKYILHIR